MSLLLDVEWKRIPAVLPDMERRNSAWFRLFQALRWHAICGVFRVLLDFVAGVFVVVALLSPLRNAALRRSLDNIKRLRLGLPVEGERLLC